MDDRPTACAWCGAPVSAEWGRLAGRTRCARCGVATTDPWPSSETLAAAYAGWYRPVGGRFLGVGDATKAREQLGWEARTTFEELVPMMVDADIELLTPTAERLKAAAARAAG